MKMTLRRKNRYTELLKNHIKANIKEYIIIATLLLIGIVLGVLFVNNLNELQIQDIQTYLNNFINSLKDGSKIDNLQVLKKSITANFILVLTMWFAGTTIIGIPVVIGLIIFRGFCLGYTVSAVIAILGIGKGILFFVASILFQNLIFIPGIITLGVSGINIYQSIMKDKRKENIKIEILRHTIISLIILVILSGSSIIESYISSNLMMLIISLI